MSNRETTTIGDKKCILYLHGIGSGAESSTPKNLMEEFPDYEILHPELPVSPKAAYEFIKENYWFKDNIDMVIGTSLGGFYALSMPWVRKLVVNPAMFADEDILKHIGLGEKPFFSARSDGAETYTIDDRFIQELADIREKIYGKESRDVWYPDRLDINELNSTFGAFAEHDTTLDSHFDDFCRIYRDDHAYKISGDHRMTKEVIHNEIVPLINRVLESPEPPCVLVLDEDFD